MLKSNALATIQKIHNYWKNIFLKGPIHPKLNCAVLLHTKTA
jgi:hypothetical protein